MKCTDHTYCCLYKKKTNAVNIGIYIYKIILTMGALLYCMHVRLCMLNVSVEASRFKKAVINIILRVLILPYNGLFSTKEIKLRSDCNLLSYYHRQIFNYALYSCCIIGRGIR